MQPRSLRHAGTVPAGSLSRCIVQARFLLESEERNYCIFLKKLWDGEGRGGEEPLILIQNSKMSSLVRARSLLSKLNTSLARGLASKLPCKIMKEKNEGIIQTHYACDWLPVPRACDWSPMRSSAEPSGRFAGTMHAYIHACVYIRIHGPGTRDCQSPPPMVWFPSSPLVCRSRCQCLGAPNHQVTVSAELQQVQPTCLSS